MYFHCYLEFLLLYSLVLLHCV